VKKRSARQSLCFWAKDADEQPHRVKMGRPAKRPARPVLPRNRAPWRRPDDRKLETCKLNDVDPQAWLAGTGATTRPPRESDLRNAAVELESRSPGNRDLHYPPIASPRSACGAPQMHMRVQCTTHLAHGLQLNGRGPSHICVHRVLSRRLLGGCAGITLKNCSTCAPSGRCGLEGHLSFGQQRHLLGSAWVLQKMPRAAYD